MKRRLFMALALASLSTTGRAEKYLVFEPLDTLGDLRHKLPGAAFTRLSPAWTVDYQALYKISGSGLSGLIYAMFDDSRALYRVMASDRFEASKPDKEIYAGKARDLSDDAAMTLAWVRWMPEAPIPMERVYQRYGPFDERGVSEDDFKPVRGWRRRGVRATLSDDEKGVIFLEFHFTQDEMNAALKRRNIDVETAVTNPSGTIYLAR